MFIVQKKKKNPKIYDFFYDQKGRTSVLIEPRCTLRPAARRCAIIIAFGRPVPASTPNYRGIKGREYGRILSSNKTFGTTYAHTCREKTSVNSVGFSRYLRIVFVFRGENRTTSIFDFSSDVREAFGFTTASFRVFLF